MQEDLFGNISVKDLNMELKAHYLSWYVNRENNPSKLEYYWTGKDSKHLQQISTKLRTFLKGRGKDPKDFKLVFETFTWLLKNLPDWLEIDPTVAKINSHWMSVINHIINVRNTKIRASTIADIIKGLPE